MERPGAWKHQKQEIQLGSRQSVLMRSKDLMGPSLSTSGVKLKNGITGTKFVNKSSKPEKRDNFEWIYEKSWWWRLRWTPVKSVREARGLEVGGIGKDRMRVIAFFAVGTNHSGVSVVAERMNNPDRNASHAIHRVVLLAVELRSSKINKGETGRGLSTNFQQPYA
ncbi:hypothetical protein T265_09392 [Opisthorchis viverrini]|uniref:Uncharacterized protein n=1 Tax=Opisthorchis viverrini TaxID=6198 RepID=A0A074Z659_OPIVI|nr:hypothetical protein T265_09392 [Opisthorchis viverrini]KER22563.1 hypothetical protein T265_09392 [Opisthorchis viverrini]